MTVVIAEAWKAVHDPTPSTTNRSKRSAMQSVQRSFECTGIALLIDGSLDDRIHLKDMPASAINMSD
jgi:hypothetical protein